MGDLVSFPTKRPRVVLLDGQPPAVTMPGEPWHLNAYDLRQIVVHRGAERVPVGEFKTARDAIAAAQSRAIVELLSRAKTSKCLTLEYVTEVMERFGR